MTSQRPLREDPSFQLRTAEDGFDRKLLADVERWPTSSERPSRRPGGRGPA